MGDRAAIVHVSDDGKTVSFDPQTGFIDFPGGRTKFTVPRRPVGLQLGNVHLDPFLVGHVGFGRRCCLDRSMILFCRE